MLDTNQSRSRKEFPRRKLASRLLPTTIQPLYHCPAGMSSVVEAIVLCNVTTSQSTVRIHHVTPIEATGSSNAIMFDIIVRPNSTTTVELPMYCVDGDRIMASSSVASSVCVTLYGYEG